jgi:putative transposase
MAAASVVQVSGFSCAAPAIPPGRKLNGPTQPERSGVAHHILARADARVEIAVAFERTRAGAPSLARALRDFAAAYDAGAIAVSAATRALFPRRSAESIQRDWRRWRRGGAAALLSRRKRRVRIIDSVPAMGELVLAMIAHQPHVRVRRIHEALAVRFPNVRFSYSAVRDWRRTWGRENPALMMRLRDPDDYKRKFSLAIGDAAADIVRVDQLWEIDGTKLEVQCTDGLFHLNAVIDVRSRRMVATLSPSASAAATAGLLRKSIAAFGVPEKIKSDWGGEYLNARIERAAHRLGIVWQKVARPYAGELKPFVERGQGTVLHMFFEQCPGFKGHNVRQNAEIKARHSFQARRGERRNIAKLYNVALSSGELQALLDRWLAAVYENRAHRGLGGRTPREVWAAGEARGEVRRVSEMRALDLLLAEDGEAVVGTKGVRVSGAFFWDDALIEWLGRKVQWVRTRDAGQLVICSADGEQFICIALDLAAAGIDRQVVAIAAKAREKQVMREQLDELRRLKRAHRPERLLDEIIQHAAARAAVALPADVPLVESLPYRTDALRAASDALAALDAAPAPAPIEHPDHDDLDAEALAERPVPEPYDEAAEMERAAERYASLRAIPSEQWSSEDRAFVELMAPLMRSDDRVERRLRAAGVGR